MQRIRTRIVPGVTAVSDVLAYESVAEIYESTGKIGARGRIRDRRSDAVSANKGTGWTDVSVEARLIRISY
jgi:hypothetical protein